MSGRERAAAGAREEGESDEVRIPFYLIDLEEGFEANECRGHPRKSAERGNE